AETVRVLYCLTHGTIPVSAASHVGRVSVRLQVKACPRQWDTYLHPLEEACSSRIGVHCCVILFRHAGDGNSALGRYSRRRCISAMSASRTTAKSPRSSVWYNLSTTASGSEISNS